MTQILDEETVESQLDSPEENLPSLPSAEFITGEAGTGKTWLVKERARRYPGHVLCATTGIAAVNLGEGVTTINSLLKYFDTASLRDSWTQGNLERIVMGLARSGVRQIVLDEVSMLDGEQLTIITATIDAVNERLVAAGEATIGLTLTGDYCQLPPVKAKFAFEVEEWQKYAQNITKLTEVRRQADKPFVTALGHARKGNGKEAMEFFKSATGFQQQTDYDFNGTTLLAKNDEVDKFNFLRMGKLQTEKIQFKSTRWGKERTEWKNIPETLEIKINALVMVLSNKSGEQKGQLVYANGDLGTVVEVDSSGAPWVKLQRNSQVVKVEYVTRNNKIPLEPGRRKELRAEGKEELIADKYEIIGGVTYMPLRVAYASTCHKAQGLTLDNVQIDFRNSFYGQPSMLYVALSRARTANGLRLVGNEQTFVGRMKMSPAVKEWA